MFREFEGWVNLVRGLLDAITPARLAAGHSAPLLYYTEADCVADWPYIPHNLTHFSMDDCKLSTMSCSRLPCVPVVRLRTTLPCANLDGLCGCCALRINRPPGMDVREFAQMRRRRLASPARVRERDGRPLGLPALAARTRRRGKF